MQGRQGHRDITVTLALSSHVAILGWPRDNFKTGFFFEVAFINTANTTWIMLKSVFVIRKNNVERKAQSVVDMWVWSVWGYLDLTSPCRGGRTGCPSGHTSNSPGSQRHASHLWCLSLLSCKLGGWPYFLVVTKRTYNTQNTVYKARAH